MGASSFRELVQFAPKKRQRVRIGYLNTCMICLIATGACLSTQPEIEGGNVPRAIQRRDCMGHPPP
jgi:hypothetical protein